MNINYYATTILIYIFYFFVFFPYITPVETPFDTQIYALFFGIIIFLFFGSNKIPRPLFILSIVFIFSVVLFQVSDLSLRSARSMTNYISIFFISCATYKILKRGNDINIYFMTFVVICWLIVGVVQLFIYPDFMIFFLSRADGLAEHGRGVLSLATEPTYYGFMCFFMIFFLFHYKQEKNISINMNYLNIKLNIDLKKILIFLLVIQIFFIAKSTAVILVFAGIGFVYLLQFLNFKKALNIILLLGLLLILQDLFFSYFQGSRFLNFFTALIENPVELILSDRSLNARLSHVVLSITTSFENYLMPHGYNNIDHILRALINSDIFMLNKDSYPLRIMCTYGATLYEMGFIGLIIPIIFNIALWNYHKKLKPFILSSTALNLALLNAVPLALPILGFILGYTMYVGEWPNKLTRGN